MPHELERLRTALADRYWIERELGRGGMATVYLARDLKHERRVAIKVLQPALAAVLGSERFLREIKLTAQLNHPHILPLLDSGEAGAVLYYVMPYVEGESLRDRLNREKQLPIEDALQIAQEIADALDYAHRHDLVHRDIKPENILLADRHAVVADFGIARAISAAGGERLTETGVAVGTPEYMSPEQAGGGRALDGRSDLYALGCVLHEMLAGQPPFTGPTVESVVHQHLSADPPDVTSMRRAVPEEIVRLLRRALGKAPADRPASGAALAQALREAVAPSPASRRGVPLWAWRWQRKAALVIGVVAVLGLLALLAVRFSSRVYSKGQPLSFLAVLPFTNQTGDRTLDYFVTGMQNGLIGRLAANSALVVKSNRAVARYRNTRLSTAEIADELTVGALIEGDATHVGNSVALEVHLVQARPERELWGQRFAAAVGDVYRMYADRS
jgi:serine/threonine-protein kinase